MNIVIIDDHKFIIDGLEMLLGMQKNICIQKTYHNAHVFISDLQNGLVNPDIVLTDLMMPELNGLELSKILKKDFPQIKIIILSMNCDAKVVYELVEKIGVEGYLSKNINRKELQMAIDDVALGYFHLSDESAKALSDYKKKLFDYGEVKLSPREKEIVKLMIEGEPNRKIAEQLFISESTVETHRKNIFRKTEVHSLPRLIKMVNELGLLGTF